MILRPRGAICILVLMTAAQAETHAQAFVPNETCVSCGAPIATPFCPQCGEQRAGDRHYTLAHFAEETLESFVHADGRLVASVRALVLAPGSLTVAYLAGRRRPYLAPLQLFLVLNVLFFLLGATRFAIRVFDTPLQTHMQQEPYSERARVMVNARLAERHVTLETYQEIFNHAATAQAKSLVILLVPAFALCTAIVVLPRRRTAVAHIIFALHAIGMLLLLLLVLWLALLATALVGRAVGMHVSYSDKVFSAIIAVLFGAWLARALRVAYGGSGVASVVRAVLLTLCMMPILTEYRHLLFFVTFYTT